MTEPATARRRRSWPQRLLISFNVFVVVGALVCAAGLGYLNLKLSKLHRVTVSQALTSPGSAPTKPQNYLLVGTDSDAGLAANDPAVQGRGSVTGQRSDTIMLLHIDPSSSQAQLVSVPRDLWVTVPGTGSKSKVNSALEIGGPKLLIQTVENALNVPINHYVEINFEGFKQLVKAVGGVPIYFNVPVRDAEFCSYGPGCVNGIRRHSILDIENPGCVTLNPDEALAYARSRYFQYKVNGRWTADPNGDLGRISRQQDFVRTALKRALSKAVHDPLKLNSLIDSGLQAVTVDDKLTTGDVFALGRRFRSFNPNTLKTIELPVNGAGDNVNVVLDDAKAAPILAPFRMESSNPGGSVQPRQVKVQVLNGSGRTGQASDISQGLTKAGFGTGTAGDAAGQGGAATVIRYAAGDEASARLVARYLDGPVSYQTSSELGSGSITIITSSSLRGVRSTPASESAVPGPSTSAPASTSSTTTPAGSGTNAGGASPSAPPSTAGFVPNQPPPGVSCG